MNTEHKKGSIVVVLAGPGVSQSRLACLLGNQGCDVAILGNVALSVTIDAQLDTHYRKAMSGHQPSIGAYWQLLTYMKLGALNALVNSARNSGQVHVIDHSGWTVLANKSDLPIEKVKVYELEMDDIAKVIEPEPTVDDFQDDGRRDTVPVNPKTRRAFAHVVGLWLQNGLVERHKIALRPSTWAGPTHKGTESGAPKKAPNREIPEREDSRDASART